LSRKIIELTANTNAAIWNHITLTDKVNATIWNTTETIANTKSLSRNTIELIANTNTLSRNTIEMIANTNPTIHKVNFWPGSLISPIFAVFTADVAEDAEVLYKKSPRNGDIQRIIDSARR
jgi:hypothetical protein